MDFSLLTVSMDSNLKDSFETVCMDVGIDMEKAVNIFANAVVEQHRIPFEIEMDDVCQKIEESYEKGKGEFEKSNYEKAFGYWSYAANHNHVFSQDKLGYMYKNGLGVDSDIIKALKWYRKAADQGYAPSQYSLGLMLY